MKNTTEKKRMLQARLACSTLKIRNDEFYQKFNDSSQFYPYHLGHTYRFCGGPSRRLFNNRKKLSSKPKVSNIWYRINNF